MDTNTPDAKPEAGDRHESAPTTRYVESFVALQRAGLRASLTLAHTTVAPAESAVEDRHRLALASADSALQRAVADIEKRTLEGLSAVERCRAEETARVQTEYETAAAALEEHTRSALDRLAATSHELTTDLDYQLQDQWLLADTVSQAAFERLRQECSTVEQQAAGGRRRLEQIHTQALRELQRYRISAPPLPQTPAVQAVPPAEATAEYERQAESAADLLYVMQHLWALRLFSGVRFCILLIILGGLVLGVFGALSYFAVAGAPRFEVSGPLSLGATVMLLWLFGWAIRHDGKARLLASYELLAHAVAAGHQVLDQWVGQAQQRYQRHLAKAADADRHNPEKRTIRRRFDKLLDETRRREGESRREIQETCRRQQAELERRRDAALHEATEKTRVQSDELRRQGEREIAAARAMYQLRLDAAAAQYEAERASLRAAWQEGRQHLQRLLRTGDHLLVPQATDWECAEPARDATVGEFAALIPFGHWHLDLTRLSPRVPELTEFLAERAATETTRALLAVPDHCSLLLQTDRAGRQQAISTLRVIMLRLLTALRPGRVRFTIMDPVGLGESFAGFMHLVDYEETLVGARIWTDSEQIEARLTELTGHMETVIQKYLRNEFPTIDAYNRQAGQLAEPYRFLVVADFPTNFTEGAIRRLASIISSGARCGVFTLIMHDRRLGLPSDLPLEDLVGEGLHLAHAGEGYQAQDELLRHFPLELDAPPPEDVLTRVLREVGRRAKHAFRVEVPFEALVPDAEQRWSGEAAAELSIPIGFAGAIRTQRFSLGRGLAQHALVAGKTGSGKSTLLHVIITNLALWYPPEEVDLYLVDFKKGVEFKTYVTHGLPHARAIAIESDREFGVSVLQRLDAEMTRRGELFRTAGVQDLPAYRAATGQVMPRALLIVDEFQVFFTEDDKLAQEAAVLLDRLVRQGRAFGIHILLGSQTLAGYAGLARSTMGQMAVRIALQCSETDSQLILDDTNPAARLLSRPGEAIYNDAGGLVQGNNTFQVAWLPDERQSAHLADLQTLAGKRRWSGPPAIVFEGNALANLQRNPLAVQLIEEPHWPASAAAPQVWLGEPVAIKDPTGVALRRQSGANLLLVGQRDDVALAMLAGAMLCLGSQQAPSMARFVILGGAAAEQPVTGGLQGAAACLPHEIRWVDWREILDVIAELAAETQRRIEQGASGAPAIYLLVNGLQRYRMLRRREDSFSFSSDEEASPSSDRQFAELLREGPPVGVHILAWSDTLATLERTLDHRTLREFDNRVLFQMSAADSSNLIDSPEANRLGLYRALFFSEERGLLEKFRPYGALDPDWLKHVRECLQRKAATQ